jgi:hypothetical protein
MFFEALEESSSFAVVADGLREGNSRVTRHRTCRRLHNVQERL